MSYRDNLRLLELYPRSTYVVLDRGTHGIPINTSETSVFGALVRDWTFKASMYQLTSTSITRTLGDLNDHTDPTGKKLSSEDDFKQFLPHFDKIYLPNCSSSTPSAGDLLRRQSASTFF